MQGGEVAVLPAAARRRRLHGCKAFQFSDRKGAEHNAARAHGAAQAADEKGIVFFVPVVDKRRRRFPPRAADPAQAERHFLPSYEGGKERCVYFAPGQGAEIYIIL